MTIEFVLRNTIEGNQFKRRAIKATAIGVFPGGALVANLPNKTTLTIDVAHKNLLYCYVRQEKS